MAGKFVSTLMMAVATYLGTCIGPLNQEAPVQNQQYEIITASAGDSLKVTDSGVTYALIKSNNSVYLGDAKHNLEGVKEMAYVEATKAIEKATQEAVQMQDSLEQLVKK